MGIRPHDAVQGRAFYVLVLIVTLNMIYPITSGGSVISLLIFQVLYAGLFAVGIIITSDNRRQVIWSVSLAALWLLFATVSAFNPGNFWWNVITYFILMLFHASITWVLFRYIFTATAVTADVIYGAIAVYFLLSFFFVPVYGLVEIASPGSFIDNGTGAPVQWQQLVYYSLITLSTAGYGDISPISPWSRMLAGLEATVGVMYVAILMARLVSLYDRQQRVTE
jgi:voltage-gated potassium channel